ncbi:MAG: conjugal transfer protein TraX [Spirochaetaceae bacterium]|jgi:hypothetical protein|nr:conjugal transfer protein TraX [Spirochaetaceae bacterium]
MKDTTTADRHPWRILSGTGIKAVGIILMTLDHVHQMFVAQGAPDWLSWLGRPVAAMFLFLCAEGFFYTRSRKRYMLQLLAGFLFMSAMNGIVSLALPMEQINLINNIFGTLFLAAWYMGMIDRVIRGFREKSPAKILPAAGGMLLPLIVSLAALLALQSKSRTAALILLFIPNPLLAEGGFIMVFMGVAFSLLRKYRFAQAALVLTVSAFTWYFSKDSVPASFEWLIVFAIIPIILYNGKRGKVQKSGKYFFYVYYPAHIYLLYGAAWFLGG